jgi:hypothetical protein
MMRTLWLLLLVTVVAVQVTQTYVINNWGIDEDDEVELGL